MNIQQRLQAAGEQWENPELAETILLQTLEEAPESEEVQIALYRFYLYRHELEKALKLADSCLCHAARSLGIPEDWRKIEPEGTDFGEPDNPRHRFYLISLNAFGYLLARLGRTGESEQVLSVAQRLDPSDRIGSGRLLKTIQAGPLEE